MHYESIIQRICWINKASCATLKTKKFRVTDRRASVRTKCWIRTRETEVQSFPTLQPWSSLRYLRQVTISQPILLPRIVVMIKWEGKNLVLLVSKEHENVRMTFIPQVLCCQHPWLFAGYHWFLFESFSCYKSMAPEPFPFVRKCKTNPVQTRTEFSPRRDVCMCMS